MHFPPNMDADGDVWAFRTTLAQKLYNIAWFGLNKKVIVMFHCGTHGATRVWQYCHLKVWPHGGAATVSRKICEWVSHRLIDQLTKWPDLLVEQFMLPNKGLENTHIWECLIFLKWICAKSRVDSSMRPDLSNTSPRIKRDIFCNDSNWSILRPEA